MREFCKDYLELCKESGRFYKKHWLGCIITNAVLISAEFCWIFRDNIREKIDNKFGKKNEKES